MKQKMLQMLGWAVISMCLPYLITLIWTGQIERQKNELDYSGKTIIVEGEQMDLENFVIYILAEQIPPEYPAAALQSQAVIARTYLYQMLQGQGEVSADTLSIAYKTLSQMKKEWGDRYTEYYKNLENAVAATAGRTLKYEGGYIDAMFHHACAGYTRSGGEQRPYLMPVASDDVSYEGFLSISTWTPDEFVKKIQELHGDTGLSASGIMDTVQIVERDEGGYITAIQIGTALYKGEEIQEALGLSSPSFTIESFEDKIRIVCQGDGHGFGLSQWGAARMAENGSTFEEILNYYYKNIELASEF